MAETKPKGQSFTSWKLDLLNAACMDERLKPATFRLLMRLAEAMDDGTWERDSGVAQAYIGDDVIADEVPGFKDRHTIRDHRKALHAAGWLTYQPGRGAKATIYRITDKPANALLDRRDELREARKTRRETERLAYMEGGKLPQIRQGGRGQTAPRNGDVHPRVHLKGSPEPISPTVKGMALEALTCVECGEPAVAIECDEPFCARHVWMGRQP